MLTMFILPCGNIKYDTAPERAFESAEKVADEVIIPAHGRLWEMQKPEGWYGFLYANEWLDQPLIEAIPGALKSFFDIFVLYKKVRENGIPKFFHVPRLFRDHVVINETYVPSNFGTYSIEYLINGWVMEHDRNRV